MGVKGARGAALPSGVFSLPFEPGFKGMSRGGGVRVGRVLIGGCARGPAEKGDGIALGLCGPGSDIVVAPPGATSVRCRLCT